MTKRDYYDVLGIGKDASKDDIKRAYRRLAKKHHPDMNKDNPKAAEEKFKEISEAYEVLADEDKKKLYDMYGHTGVDSQFSPGGFSWSDFTHFRDIEDMFDRDLFRDFFGNGLFDAFFRRRGPVRRQVRRGRDIRIDVEVELEDVLAETKKELNIPHSVQCEKCSGSGAESGGSETCGQCGGQGQVQNVQRRGFSQFITITTCPQCHGRGKRITKPCKKCRGDGSVEKVTKLEVRIPKGVFEGLRLRIPGKGESEHGLEPGDLYVVVHLREHEDFGVEGSDIFIEVPITFSMAALGGEIEVPTLKGRARMKIPAGTQSHEIFRLKGKGLPELDGRFRGDELVRIKVAVPHKLTSEQKKALKEFEDVAKDYHKEKKGRRKFFL
ncbi:MAG: molecular chaperone DnaJ [Thermoplasmata archaeon]|nr:molecular chaperone DnaJ [Thermoplasmata archaeon]